MSQPTHQAELGLRLDHQRQRRTAIAEAVYAPGKSADECAAAVAGLLAGDSDSPVLLTRADSRKAQRALARNPDGIMTYVGESEATGEPLLILAWRAAKPRIGSVAVVTAGTGDLPVAREAAAVLHAYGHGATLISDVGVAGLHRILGETESLAIADLVIVVAGMEGALASVVTGLTCAPVIAVPTSTGYGSGFEGITALLGMMASCSPGVTVVGIDNGFGAACAAVRILRSLNAEVGHDD